MVWRSEIEDADEERTQWRASRRARDMRCVTSSRVVSTHQFVRRACRADESCAELSRVLGEIAGVKRSAALTTTHRVVRAGDVRRVASCAHATRPAEVGLDEQT